MTQKRQFCPRLAFFTEALSSCLLTFCLMQRLLDNSDNATGIPLGVVPGEVVHFDSTLLRYSDPRPSSGGHVFQL